MLCITCAADLGSEKKATSAVTGIIDGLGSLGTSVGQLVVGFTTTYWKWRYGYLLVITLVCFSTILPLASRVRKDLNEIKEIRAKRREE